MVMMTIQKNFASFLVSHPLNKFKGSSTAHSPHLCIINPSSFLRLGTSSICLPKTILAPFHSRSSSDPRTHFNNPRSKLDFITNLDDALQLFDEMSQRQPLPSVIKFNQLLQAVTKMKHYSSSIQLFKQMNMVRVPVDAYTINIVIKCCCQMYRTREGFVVSFLRLGTSSICLPKTILAPFHSRSSSDPRTHFNNPRSKLDFITNLDDALQLFDEMSQRQPLPSVIKFNQLLQAVTKMKHYSSSIQLFKQMNMVRVPVDAYTINIVIKCCCQMYRTREGFVVLGFAFKHHVPPDVCTFNTLLHGLVLEDKVLKAETLFKKLIKEKLCEPNAIMYSTMIKGLCKFGNNDTAIALLKLMDSRCCEPDVVTYSTIIDSLCKDKMVDDALKLFKEMAFHKGILPDVVTYTSLIHGLCNLCRWDEVSKMLKEMQDERISPNVQTYNILVDAVCKEGKAEDAEKVINIMIERGENPDVVTYNSLIDGYCLRGEMSKARKVFDSMEFRGVVPNVVTYSCLLNGYCKNSKIQEAMHLFHEMSRKGMKPNVITYNTMLQGLFRVGRYIDARELFNEMRAHHEIPNECTYRIVLDGLCNNNQVDEALSLFHLMGDNKLNSNISVYNILIDGASKSGKLDIARNLFNGLTVKGLKHDVWTYIVMISGFLREGLVGEASALFSEMEERGCSPDSCTYSIFLHGLLKNQQHDKVEMLLQEMDGKDFSLDASTVSLLLDHIKTRSLDTSLLKLIGKLLPKNGVDAPCFTV